VALAGGTDLNVGKSFVVFLKGTQHSQAKVYRVLGTVFDFGFTIVTHDVIT